VGVGLVIKVHPPKNSNPEWDELKELQRNDPRLHIVEQTLDRADLLALYNACDCFISLHRAEGFGRNIAEAMLLKKPVIVTGYSGNLIYTKPDNSFLVKCKMIALKKGDYPYGDEQIWAEPDIEHAASLMRHLVRRREEGDRRAEYGSTTILRAHSCETVGARYAQALA
jgi:glycosyltransferase involved in cell wall biosynthesis